MPTEPLKNSKGTNTDTSTTVTPVFNTAAGLYDEKVTALTGLDAGNYVLAASGNSTALSPCK